MGVDSQSLRQGDKSGQIFHLKERWVLPPTGGSVYASCDKLIHTHTPRRRPCLKAGRGPSPIGGAPTTYRSVETVIGPDERTMDMYYTLPTGDESQIIACRYKRQK
jgi:hypothetical protein